MRNFDTLKLAIISSAVIAALVTICAIVYFVFLNPGSDFKISQVEKSLVVNEIDTKVSETIKKYGEGTRNSLKHDDSITVTNIVYDNQKLFNYDVTKAYIYAEPIIVTEAVTESPIENPDPVQNPDQTIVEAEKISETALAEIKEKEATVEITAIVYEVKDKATVSVNDLFEDLKAEFGTPNHIEMKDDGIEIFTADWTVNGKIYNLTNDNTVLSLTITDEV